MSRLSLFPRGFWRLLRLTGERRALLAEAMIHLLLVRLRLMIVPFPKLIRRVGGCMPPADPRAAQIRQDSMLPEHASTALEVSWAVTRAAEHMPLKFSCLPQAMSARAMLKQRGIRSVLHFGTAAGNTTPLVAHVWLEAAGVEVTGYPVGGQFTEIACFV